ncbi:unnamed protein product [Hymenolepis diminuta]|uniref:Uncharacterized protein n=1 Tax=Hymenolepis diminuta TaxID=6216 RepID=A0A0R3SSU4_HYMDI|nr:unnamed protein product [Hymenolepis diminuta]VUZ41574.1 unnamed protein product [Hymenolepis diminuta]
MGSLLAQNFPRAIETATKCTDAKRDDKTREECRVNAKCVKFAYLISPNSIEQVKKLFFLASSGPSISIVQFAIVPTSGSYLVSTHYTYLYNQQLSRSFVFDGNIYMTPTNFTVAIVYL